MNGQLKPDELMIAFGIGSGGGMASALLRDAYKRVKGASRLVKLTLKIIFIGGFAGFCGLLLSKEMDFSLYMRYLTVAACGLGAKEFLRLIPNFVNRRIGLTNDSDSDSP